MLGFRGKYLKLKKIVLKKRRIPGLLLTMKVTMTVTSIVIFSMMLLNFVTYLKYDNTLTNVIGSRFLVITEDLLQTISKGLDLGLSLRELQTTQEVIENVKKNDPQILSISVFGLSSDGSGNIFYNTRHAGIGGKAPSLWINTLKAHVQAKYWLIDEDDVGSVGVTLMNNFKEPIGGVIVRYDQRQIDVKGLYFLKNITLYSIIALIVSGCVIFGFTHLIFRNIGSSFQNMQKTIQRFLLSEHEIPMKPRNNIEEKFQSSLSSTKDLWKKLEVMDELMDEKEDNDAKN